MDEELVILVQGYPALYDMSNKDYDNTPVKDNIWKRIGESIKKTADECKAKWTLLRSYFVRARARRKTTSGQSAKKTRKWRLEDQMEFLVPFLQDRLTQSNLPSIELDEDFFADVEKETDSPSASSTPLPSPATVSATKPKYGKLQRSTTTTKSEREQGLEQTLCKFISTRTSSEISAEKKALMVFFDDIAESMLQFSAREKAEIKRDIFRIVNDKEIEKSKGSEGNFQVEAAATECSQNILIASPTETQPHLENIQLSAFYDNPVPGESGVYFLNPQELPTTPVQPKAPKRAAVKRAAIY